jgi:predicted amidohydrolase
LIAIPNIKVAAAQLAPEYFDRDKTVLKACAAIDEAGANGKKLDLLSGSAVGVFFQLS